jgi:hypothetical protein
MQKFNELDYIMRYESGELRGGEVLELFSHLLKTGRVWHLQGSYGRYAEILIKRGYLSPEGNILEGIN